MKKSSGPSMVEKRLDLASHRRRLEELERPDGGAAGWIVAAVLMLAALLLIASQR